MSKLEFLEETTAQICKDIFQGQLLVAPDFAELHIILANKILQLLSEDINQLMNILYRLDISETKVKQTFKLLSKEDIATQLAELIIQRELQKVETRSKYSGL